MCTGMAYYLQAVVMKERGPVFVTAFSPLCMIIVAFMGSTILAEEIALGRYRFSNHRITFSSTHTHTHSATHLSSLGNH